MVLGRRGPLTKLIGGGIGLTQEYNAHRKSQKSPKPSDSNSSSSQQRHLHPSDGGQETGVAPSTSHGSRSPSPSADEEDYDSDRSSDHDEEDWELDEISRDVARPDKHDLAHGDALSQEDNRDVNQLLDAFFQRHPQPPQYTETPRLPCPVILPQRRPGMNTRGFVHAYAPVLGDCGIDQATFMDFLTGFHKAIKVSTILFHHDCD